MRRLGPRGVRWRVTAAVTLLFTVALGGGSALLLGRIEAALVGDVHDVALASLEQVRGQLSAEVGPGVVSVETVGPAAGSSIFAVDSDAVVATRDGEVAPPGVGRTVAGAEEVRTTVESGGARVPAWLAATDGSVAVTSLVEPAAGGRVQLLVASPLDSVRRTVATARRLLAAVIPALIGLIGLTAWGVAGRALRPVEAITRRTEEISGATLDARVPEPRTGDEVAHLARTVNAMLDRLEGAARSQRRFAADAAHELRTPVATIRTELEVALRDEPASWSEVAERVLAEDVRLGRLVDDLLLLARSDEQPHHHRAAEVDLDAVVADCAARLRRRPVDVRSVEPARVHGDAVDLGRAVDHLLDNAARHARSRVRVSTERGPDGVELHVDDDGRGIAAADRELVLERFARLDEARSRDQGGAGLGLAVVDRIASQHGGAIVVSDGPLGGARFTFRLPWPSDTTRPDGGPAGG